jgi:hypothetical protein
MYVFAAVGPAVLHQEPPASVPAPLGQSTVPLPPAVPPVPRAVARAPANVSWVFARPRPDPGLVGALSLAGFRQAITMSPALACPPGNAVCGRAVMPAALSAARGERAPPAGLARHGDECVPEGRAAWREEKECA